jgi:hypothetical protein
MLLCFAPYNKLTNYIINILSVLENTKNVLQSVVVNVKQSFYFIIFLLRSWKVQVPIYSATQQKLARLSRPEPKLKKTLMC